jgi:hypothetical protein
MEKKKLNRIIQILREEMMTANPPGGQGGFGGNPTPSSTEKTRAGFNPVMGKMMRRKKKYIKLPPGSRKRWTPQKDES